MFFQLAVPALDITVVLREVVTETVAQVHGPVHAAGAANRDSKIAAVAFFKTGNPLYQKVVNVLEHFLNFRLPPQEGYDILL